MKKVFTKGDKILLVICFIFIVFGLIMILSASSMESYMRRGSSPYYYFFRQLLFTGLGFILFLSTASIPLKIYKKFDIPIVVLAFLLLIGLFFFGYSSNNATSWYKIGSFSFQPSELVKILIILFLASYYDKNKYFLDSRWKLFKPLIIIILLLGLVIIQPDMGTAFLIFCIAFFMFLSVPMKKKVRRWFYKLITASVLAVGLVFVFTGGSFLKSYQVDRLLSFSDPCERYQDKTGYQVCNSFIAFKNGGYEGQGIGKSTQKYLYLPESYTDFIFPIIVEEWGVFVGALIIILYFVIIYRLYTIAKNANNLNNSLISYGVCIYLFIHIAVNLIGVMGLGPLTGVPLPFLSYGGSYTWCLFIGLGLAQRVAIETNIENCKNEKKMKKNKKSLA